MYEKGVLTLSNWQKGGAVSPYVGFGKLINCDIYSQLGVVKATTTLNQNTLFSSIVGTPTKVYLYGGNIFVGTDAGYVYKNGVQIASGLITVHDLVVYKDYLIITTGFDSSTGIPGGIDTYGPISGFAVYHSKVLDLASRPIYGYRKLVLNTTDPVVGVWVGNEGYVASISSSFTGTADSGFSVHKFALPSGKISTTLCEYGDDLAIMTKFQNGSDFASIIFWDKAANYGSNIQLSEITCTQMISTNNRLFYVGNDTGTLYEANKSSFVKIWSIQDRRSWQTFVNMQNAICVANNQILFGFAPGITTNPDPVFYGVYSYQVGVGVAIRNTVSSGNYGKTQGLSIGALAAQNQGIYYVGYQDGSSVGVDNTNITSYATAHIECELFQVGTTNAKKTFKTVEVNLGENMPVGSAIVIGYRTATNANFIPVRTITAPTSGLVSRFEESFAVADLTTFQPEIQLVPGTSNFTTPALLSAYIK